MALGIICVLFGAKIAVGLKVRDWRLKTLAARKERIEFEKKQFQALFLGDNSTSNTKSNSNTGGKGKFITVFDN